MIAEKRQYVYCTAVLYSDWSLQMDQMRPKMTLGTLTMGGDDFLGVKGILRGSNSVLSYRHLSAIMCSILTQCTAYGRGSLSQMQ